MDTRRCDDAHGAKQTAESASTLPRDPCQRSSECITMGMVLLYQPFHDNHNYNPPRRKHSFYGPIQLSRRRAAGLRRPEDVPLYQLDLLLRSRNMHHPGNQAQEEHHRALP